MIKKLWGILLSCLLVLFYASPAALADSSVTTSTTSSVNVSFSDVSQDYWAASAINSMVQSGIVSGYPDNTYKPGNPVTREEFATLIAKTFLLDLPSSDAQPTFYDVQPDHWSFAYVEASKDFLTGYYPPSGHAFFSPATNATREDVAVALVKAMQYTPDDLQDKTILEDTFTDADQVSPNLHDYVALAVEKKLISGYPDGTLQPQQPVTRAEAAALLYRAIKDTTSDGSTSMTLDVSAPATTTDGTVYISGDTDPGAKVTINDQPVDVIQGHFAQGFKLDQEGTYPFTVVARIPGGQTKTVTKQVTYTHAGPTIDFSSNLPDTTNAKQLTISGTVSDPADQNPKLYLNGQLISNDYSGEFQTQVDLQEGPNTLTFTATNEFGKTTTVTKTVTLTLGGPNLQIDYIPDTTSNSSLTVSGTVTDPNDQNPKVYLNNEPLNNYSSSFSKTITLNEGPNTLQFVATDAEGKQTTITKTVTFTSGAPTLTVGFIPDTTSNQNLQVTWTVKDSNDPNPQVNVNGQPMSTYENSTTVTLQPGDNTITIMATNSLGKSTTVTKTVTFTNNGPSLVLGYLPDTTSLNHVQVSWTVNDANDSNPQVYVNDQPVSYYDNSQQVNLVQGTNTITVRVTDKLGQSTTQTKTIIFNPAAPTLNVDSLPATTTNATITVNWTVSDPNDPNPVVTVNNEQIQYENQKTLTLNPGANTIVITASNKYGQTTTVTKTVTLTQ